MAIVRGCAFPDHLYYDVPNHIWCEPLADGTIRLGMTAVATALSGQVLAFVPKRVGKELEKGRSFATVESGKWVGPARVPFDGIVVAVNEAMIARPTIANEDPYGAGWMLIGRPDGQEPLAGLVTGPQIQDAYGAWMASEDFSGC